MKICHLTSAHNSLDDRIFEKECCSLAAEGYDTYIVANGDTFEKEGVRIIGIGEPPSSRLVRMLFTGYKIYKAGLELNAELYHLHDPELLLFARKLKKKGKYVIFDSHEDVPRQILAKNWIPYVLRKRVSVIYEKFEKKISKEIDFVITATPYIKSLFLKYTDHVMEVCNFPTKDSLDLSVNKKDFSTPPQQLCYAGGLTKARGLEMMIKAVGNTECKLKLAGNAEGRYVQMLESLRKGPVEYLGFLPRNKVKELYEESHIGIIILEPTPNHIQAYAIKIFEYMGAALPIICSDFPLWKKLVEENGCGICVNPLDEREIINAIEYLCSHPEKEREMGKKGKELVVEKYNWDCEFVKLSNIYRKFA